METHVIGSDKLSPVTVSVAPTNSAPPPTACLLIVTPLGSINASLISIICEPSGAQAPLTLVSKLPSSLTLKATASAVSYPLGASTSVSVYTPGCNFNI